MRCFYRPVGLSQILSVLLLLPLSLSMLNSCSVPEKTETVVLGATASLLNSLLWIAQEKGYFKEQGLDVQFKIYPTGKRSLKGMLAGEAEVSTTADVPFMANLYAHPELRLIATIGSSDDELKIVTRTDRGIASPADLKGKIIATQKASAVHFFLHLFLLQHYISEQDVSIQYMKAEELPIALAEGKIDAFSMREPFINQARILLSDNIQIFSEPALYRKTYNLVTSEQYIKEKPHIIKKLLKALLSAEQFIEENPDKARMIMAELLNIETAEVKKLWNNFVLRVLLEQDFLLQLQMQEGWSKQFATQFPQQDVASLPVLQSLHLDSLLQVAPERVGLKPVNERPKQCPGC